MWARGFTLLELLITVALVAILAGLGTGPVGQMNQRSQLDHATQDLWHDLSYARQQAMSRGITVSACGTRDGRSCQNNKSWNNGWIVFLNPERKDSPAENADVLLRHQVANSTVDIGDNRGTPVHFDFDGRSAGSNRTWTLCAPLSTTRKSLILSNSGRVRMDITVRSPSAGGC